MSYVYTKEGIANVKNIRIGRISKYEKEALKKGYKPSKVIGGIKYFDFDELFMLTKKPKKITNKKSQKAKRIQLSFYDIDDFF